jgi:Na+-translocating ferredoxin:NAD+ oxidoreductase RnfE subunit
MSKSVSIIYKIIGAILVAYGIAINLVGSTNMLELMSYFTMISNLMVVAVLSLGTLVLLKVVKIDVSLFRKIKGATIVATILMMVVYNFILIPFMRINIPSYQIYSIKDIFIHFLSPIIILADYLLFDEKGLFEYRDAFSFMYYLLIYFVYLIIYELLGGRFIVSGVETIYPYFFLNIEVQGIWLTLFNILLIGLVFTGFGLLLVWVDQILKRPIKKISL